MSDIEKKKETILKLSKFLKIFNRSMLFIGILILVIGIIIIIIKII